MGKQAQQGELPMDLPPAATEAAMRDLFERRWSRWHRAHSYEEAVADPITRRLLALQVVHEARVRLCGRRR